MPSRQILSHDLWYCVLISFRTLLLREQGKDFRTGQAIDESIFYDDAIDIHHIFPAIWCERTGIPIEKELSYRQQAANFIQDMGQRLKV